VLGSKSQIIEAIKTVATALGNINEQVVYVGCSVVGLYADDPGAPEVHPTKDIDIVLEIASLLELEVIRQNFAERGIHFAKDEDVMCRFIYQNILIDVMATKEVGWAPTNPWFKVGFDSPEIHYLDEAKIKILPLAYYLASKFTAFANRGSDPRTSPDFEDIVYVLDNRKTLVKDILESEEDVKSFLITELTAVQQNPFLQEAVLAHLEPATQTQRFEMLIHKLKEIII
jgi:hypothetical protein